MEGGGTLEVVTECDEWGGGQKAKNRNVFSRNTNTEKKFCIPNGVVAFSKFQSQAVALQNEHFQKNVFHALQKFSYANKVCMCHGFRT